MKLLLATMFAAVVASVTSTAHAGTLRLEHRPWRTMNNAQKIHYLKRQLHHDRSILRFFRHNPEIQTVERKKEVHWARTSMRIVQKNLKKLVVVPRVAVSSSVISALLCIHRYEGAWDDPNSPYWGGLQMDMSFQASYGGEFLKRWGTADNWPVWAQLQAGARGVAARGYSPWPNTARYCGLL